MTNLKPSEQESASWVNHDSKLESDSSMSRPAFIRELRSGDFGYDNGCYHVYAEVYGNMVRGGWRSADACYGSRQEARDAIGSTIGHCAIVGVKNCAGCDTRMNRMGKVLGAWMEETTGVILEMNFGIAQNALVSAAEMEGSVATDEVIIERAKSIITKELDTAKIPTG